MSLVSLLPDELQPKAKSEGYQRPSSEGRSGRLSSSCDPVSSRFLMVLYVPEYGRVCLGPIANGRRVNQGLKINFRSTSNEHSKATRMNAAQIKAIWTIPRMISLLSTHISPELASKEHRASPSLPTPRTADSPTRIYQKKWETTADSSFFLWGDCLPEGSAPKRQFAACLIFSGSLVLWSFDSWCMV